jgi:hypothetical protein
MKPTKHAMMKEDCGATLINQDTLCITVEAAVAEKNEEPEVVTSSSSPYDENTDDEDFTSSSRRNDVACSRRRDHQSMVSTAIPEKVASSVYEEDTDNEEMVSPEKEGEQQIYTSSRQRSASTQITCVAVARDDSSSKSSDGQTATNRKRKPLEEDGRTPKKFDWKKYRHECPADGCKNVWYLCMRHGRHCAKVKRCSSERCTNQVRNGGVCKRHGAKIERKLCSSEGCTNRAVKRGVCVKHGAKYKLCSSEGCNNKAQKGGVCRRHGAKAKRCTSEGCTNQAKQGGVCRRHGATVTRWSSERCRNKVPERDGEQRTSTSTRQRSAWTQNTSATAARDGSFKDYRTPKKVGWKNYRHECPADGCKSVWYLCIRHGAKTKRMKQEAKIKRCSSEGCTSFAQKGGVCIKHGAKHKRCSIEDCTNQAKTGGVCIRHGATWTKKRCSSDGCTSLAQRGGVCIRHGARKECKYEGCTNHVQKGGVCIRHGAKIEYKRCSVEGCTTFAKEGGVCRGHGANKTWCKELKLSLSLSQRQSNAQNAPA